MRFLKQSHSAEKLERGDPLGFLKLQLAAKYQKTWRGTLWRQKKTKSRSAEKKFSKKFLAKARTRTRDRWVHRKPSTDEYM